MTRGFCEMHRKGVFDFNSSLKTSGEASIHGWGAAASSGWGLLRLTECRLFSFVSGLRSIGAVSGLMLLLGASLGCVSTRKIDLSRYEYQEPHMNLPFRIVLYAADREEADRAARSAFDRIEEIN